MDGGEARGAIVAAGDAPAAAQADVDPAEAARAWFDARPLQRASEAVPSRLLSGRWRVAVMVFVGLVGWMVGRLVKGVGLSGLDRMFGLVLGLVRGLFIACAMVHGLGKM